MLRLDVYERIESLGREHLRAIADDNRARRQGFSPSGKHERFGGTYVSIDDDGQSHVKGHALTSPRAGTGITAADADAFRRDLREQSGVRIDRGQAESILGELQAILDRERTIGPTRHTPETRREKWRQKRAQRRERAKVEGICIVCLVNPADTDMVTCWRCNQKSAARRKRRKERAQ